uniref:Uncharacterized protein n=1 Tax=Lepisosteus oculatus TaxID=7918 RepID=W5MUG0_LEPOC
RTMALSKTIKTITRAQDVRNDAKMIMKPYANWEEFLMPVPISIAILGEPVFISSKTDFSINKNPPKGFKPVSYAGWGAFNEAHKNMDQIHLLSGNVPEYVKMAVRLILQDDDKLIQLMITDQLQNISSIAEECKTRPELTEKKFILIQEQMEACVNAKAACGEEAERVRRKIEEFNLRKMATEEGKQQAKEVYDNMGRQLKEAQQEFKNAMYSLPNGWNVIGMNFVQGLTNAINMRLGLGSVPLILDFFKSHQEEKINLTNPIALGNVFAVSEILLSHVDQIAAFCNSDEIDWGSLYDQKKEYAVSEWVVKRVQGFINKQEECRPKSLALEALESCSDLTCIAPLGKCDEDQKQKLINDIKNLRRLALKFDSQSKACTGASPFTVTPPQLAKHQEENDTVKSAEKIAVENVRFRIEQNCAQLDQAQNMFQKILDNLGNYHKDLSEILTTDSSFEMKEIDLKTMIKMLMKGLDAMGKVKEQWEMVHLFQMISNIIKICLSTCLMDLIKTAGKASSSELNYSSRLFLKDMLYNYAFQASNIASLVNVISGSYTEISNTYLMDSISSLGKLMVLDRSNPDFDSERTNLQKGCEEAGKGIKILVLKSKDDFDKIAKSRMEKIESAFKTVLPPTSEEDIQVIRKIVE